MAKKEIQSPVGIEKEEEIKMALNYYREYTADDKLIDMIEARKKAIRDEHARTHFAIEQARAEGEEKGLAKGKVEGKAEGKTESKVEIARNMLKMGMDKDIILQATGISVEDLKKMS